MKDVKISTEDTKKMTGLDASGIRKIRKIYQDEQKIERYELFSKAQVEEIKLIVAYQRKNPHLSYKVAYEAIKMRNVINRLKAEAPDDFTSEAILTIGEEKMERFFELFVGLEDLLREFDSESAELLKNMESAILARIVLKARKNKMDKEFTD